MIVIRRTDAEQPFHVVITSEGNNEDLMAGENLTSIHAAYDQIVAVAKEFGIVDPIIAENLNGSALLYDGNGAFRSNIYVDNRRGAKS